MNVKSTNFFTIPLFFTIAVGLPITVIGQTPPPPVSPDGGVTGISPVAPAAAYAPTRLISMSPSEKRPLMVNPAERNPYAIRSTSEELDNGGDDAEESEVRDRLSSLRVSGRSHGPNGHRILLGDLVLEPGRRVPALVADQSKHLHVVDVTEETVLLEWIDNESGELTGRTIQIGYDLSPSVRYVLSGQTLAGSSSSQGLEMGVMHIGKERRQERAALTASDPGAKLPEEVYTAGQ